MRPFLTVTSALILLTGSQSSCITTLDALDREASYTSYKASEPRGSEQRLTARVELNAGHLAIQAAPDAQLYEVDVYYDENSLEPKLQLDRQGDQADVRFELSGEGKQIRDVGKTRMNLSLNPSTALSLQTRTGISESEIDLSGMTVEEVEIEAGVGEMALSMLSRNQMVCREVSIRSGVGEFKATGLGNFRVNRLHFQGGVGGALLDFSGDWEEVAEVLVEVGVGGVQIRLPRNLGVELRATKSFLSGIDVSGFRQEGEVYYSDNYEQAQSKLKLEVRAGIGGVQIGWL